jgi:hypothetical protein
MIGDSIEILLDSYVLHEEIVLVWHHVSWRLLLHIAVLLKTLPTKGELGPAEQKGATGLKVYCI